MKKNPVTDDAVYRFHALKSAQRKQSLLEMREQFKTGGRLIMNGIPQFVLDQAVKDMTDRIDAEFLRMLGVT